MKIKKIVIKNIDWIGVLYFIIIYCLYIWTACLISCGDYCDCPLGTTCEGIPPKHKCITNLKREQ